VGVLLTGMGATAPRPQTDASAGFLTIAQDQQSSAVYGMPKAAAAIDAAVEIRPLDASRAIAGGVFEMTVFHAARRQ
jgi:two-component system response regulator WspF